MDYTALAALLFPNVTLTPADIEARYPARELPEGAVVTRSAPSPTGFVHLGNLLQGLTAERMAHQSGGVMFLRIEDTDQKRTVSGAVEKLIDGLGHYHIEFDEGAVAGGDRGDYGPYRQRQRRDIYHVFARELVLSGMAYPCFCTAEELTEIRAQQKEEKANFGYFGKWAVWRDRDFSEIKAMLEAGTPWVLRFRSTGSIQNKIPFTDLIKGKLELTENDIDHVLLKSDGIPTYHFAHAVDDRFMHTTHVVRGDEWLATLPFHLQLFRALGFKAPKYLHIGPLMKMDGTSKRKLSKRKDPELALSYFQEEGYPVAAVYEYLLTVLNSNFEDWRRVNPDKPAEDFPFSPKKMNPAGSLFDIMKLRDISRDVIARMSAEAVYDGVYQWASSYDQPFAAILDAQRDTAVSAFAIGRGGKKPRKDFALWREVPEQFAFFFDALFDIGEPYPENFDSGVITAALTGFLETYNPADDQNQWFDKIKALGESLGFTADMKAYRAAPEDYPGSVADISMFLRLAVTGRQNSPDMYQVMATLGEARVRARIQNRIAALVGGTV